MPQDDYFYGQDAASQEFSPRDFMLSPGEQAFRDRVNEIANTQSRLGYTQDEATRLEGVRSRRQAHEDYREAFDFLRQNGESRANARRILDKLREDEEKRQASVGQAWDFDDVDRTQVPENSPEDVGGAAAGGADLGTLTGYILVDGVVYNATFSGSQGDAV